MKRLLTIIFILLIGISHIPLAKDKKEKDNTQLSVLLLPESDGTFSQCLAGKEADIENKYIDFEISGRPGAKFNWGFDFEDVDIGIMDYVIEGRDSYQNNFITMDGIDGSSNLDDAGFYYLRVHFTYLMINPSTLYGRYDYNIRLNVEYEPE